MQLHTITELLSIPNYHVSHMVVHSGSRIDLLLEPSAFTPTVCSSCGRLHNTPIHSNERVWHVLHRGNPAPTEEVVETLNLVLRG